MGTTQRSLLDQPPGKGEKKKKKKKKKKTTTTTTNKQTNKQTDLLHSSLWLFLNPHPASVYTTVASCTVL